MCDIMLVLSNEVPQDLLAANSKIVLSKNAEGFCVEHNQPKNFTVGVMANIGIEAGWYFAYVRQWGVVQGWKIFWQELICERQPVPRELRERNL